ncbi:MFS transporter [Actinospica sp. MGRD01-02]|uniref:MFS transporter n=1 Tax=Actinospica acidithermotolerans TaxID=2828514 RepID=A0A941EFI5_9ACTN|nr:MFS transporter [Actinospica acidithermotolerans]MBR7830521.1 MFS transporter [Actinospica acidithermotolerans]
MTANSATGQSAATPSGTTAPPAERGWAGPVAVLALGSFAMGTDSFVLAGILPQIAHGLHTSVGAAGQVITTFALTYGLAAPFLAAFTGRLPRKPLMAAALTLFVLANLASAAAPSLGLLLAARVVAGLGAALYTPNASAAAAALAGPARRGQALAVILGGLTVGTVFGVPVGTAIGQHVSWSAALVFVAAVGAAALLGLLVTLPALPIPPAVPLGQRFRVLGNPRVVAIVLYMMLTSGASIMVYTYIANVLGTTAHATGTALAVMLLLWGVGGMAGAFGSGWLADRWGAERTLFLAVGLLVATLLLLTVADDTVAAGAVMLLNGAAGWAVSTPNNHRLITLVPSLPTVVISFNSSGIYLGQALGAGLGGLLLDGGTGVRGLCLIGAGVAVAAGVLNLAIGRPRTAGNPT